MDPSASVTLCIYCGADNPVKRRTCIVCHNDLISERDVTEAHDELVSSKQPVDISGLNPSSTVENGFSYPDWDALVGQVEKKYSKEDWSAIYVELAQQWLLQLKADLGGNYHCYESEYFLLLCAEGAAPSRTILGYAEGSLTALRKYGERLLPPREYRKRAILVFNDQEDYYAYISHFYPDGTHSLSAGITVNRGYVHIAFRFTWVFSAKPVITHELVHDGIAHLRVPTWVHEGLAQKLERMVAGQGFDLDGELAARHHALWDEQNIQEFWAGVSFYGPDEHNELSYSLAYILVELLCENWDRFLDFVLEADYRDAGQDASLHALERCLGETAAGFLGSGNWRPHRKAIATLQQQRWGSG